MILGTSDNMVHKIAENLGLPKITRIIRIDEIATEEEIETARRIRVTEGKHVIPVPTFEIKKDFSGYILDPLQIFKSKGVGKAPYVTEKSIIRPTFSYLGNFTISDSVFRQIIEYLAYKSSGIHKLSKMRITKYEDGPSIYIEVIVVYGTNIKEVLTNFKEKCKKEIERLTAMNIINIEILAKGIYVPEKEEEK